MTLALPLSTRRAGNEDAEPIRRLVFSTLAEYGLEPDPATTDADLGDIQQHYDGRGGAFRVLVDAADRVLGSAGIYRIDEGECELRKMYVDASCRGQGWGRRLLEEMIREARVRGYRRMHLETASVLGAAIALYQRFGFTRVAREGLARRCDQAWVLDL